MLIRWKRPLSALITASALSLTGTSRASDPQVDLPTVSKSEPTGKSAPAAAPAKETESPAKSSLRLPEPPPNKLIPEIEPLPEEGTKPAVAPSTESKTTRENVSAPLKSLPAMPVSLGASKPAETAAPKEASTPETKQEVSSVSTPEKPTSPAAPASEVKPEGKVVSGEPAPVTTQSVTTSPTTTAPTTAAPAPTSNGGSTFLAECLNSCTNCQTKPECFWVSAEYLFWWVRSASLPFPLLTTSTAQGGPPGALDSSVLFGGGNVNGHNPYSGARIRIGSYFDNLGFGFDVGGFFLEEKTTTYGLQSDDQSRPLLARPFYSVLDNSEAVNYISYPGSVIGGIDITYSTEVWGAEANFTRRVDLGPIQMAYVGFRYLGLNETLGIQDRSVLLPGGIGYFGGQPIGEGDIRVKNDRFQARNNFYGAQVGLISGLRRGAFDARLRSALAFGTTAQNVRVEGNSILLSRTELSRQLPGGFLALPSNIRDQSQNRFAVVPEVDLQFGWQACQWVRLFVGYNFLYCSSVVRAGDQTEQAININQMPISPTYNPGVPVGNPRPLFVTSDFWAQGLNFGVSLSF